MDENEKSGKKDLTKPFEFSAELRPTPAGAVVAPVERSEVYVCSVMNFSITDHVFSLEERAQTFAKDISINFADINSFDVRNSGLSNEEFQVYVRDTLENMIDLELVRALDFSDGEEAGVALFMLDKEADVELEALKIAFGKERFVFKSSINPQEVAKYVEDAVGFYHNTKNSGLLPEHRHLDA